MLRRIATLLALFCLLVSTARATVSRPVSVRQLAAWSELVVRGRVVSTEARLHGGQVVTRVTLDVTATLRGSSNREVRFLVHGGDVGERRVVVPGEATFVAGEDVAVFLMRGGSTLWLTSLAQGKWNVARDSEGTEWVGQSTEPGHAPQNQRVRAISYDDFVADVRSAP